MGLCPLFRGPSGPGVLPLPQAAAVPWRGTVGTPPSLDSPPGEAAAAEWADEQPTQDSQPGFAVAGVGGATPKGAGAPPLVMDLLHSRGCPVGVWFPPPTACVEGRLHPHIPGCDATETEAGGCSVCQVSASPLPCPALPVVPGLGVSSSAPQGLVLVYACPVI